MFYKNKKVLAITIIVLLCAVAYAGFSDNLELTGKGIFTNAIDFIRPSRAVDTAPALDSIKFEEEEEGFLIHPATENMFEKCVIVCGDNLALGPHPSYTVYTGNYAGQESNYYECEQTATNSPDRNNFDAEREITKCRISLVEKARKDAGCDCFEKDFCGTKDFTWVLERNKEGLMEYVKCQGIVVCPK